MYPEGVCDQSGHLIDGPGFAASLFVIATIITYAVIPSKRVFPQNVILFISISTFIYLLPNWIALFVGYQKVACNNEFDQVLYIPAFLLLGCLRVLLCFLSYFSSFSVNVPTIRHTFLQSIPQIANPECVVSAVLLLYGI